MMYTLAMFGATTGALLVYTGLMWGMPWLFKAQWKGYVWRVLTAHCLGAGVLFMMWSVSYVVVH